MNGTITVQKPSGGAKKEASLQFACRLNLQQRLKLQATKITRLKKLPGQSNPSTTKITHRFSSKECRLILLVEDNADVVAYTASFVCLIID